MRPEFRRPNQDAPPRGPPPGNPPFIPQNAPPLPQILQNPGNVANETANALNLLVGLSQALRSV